MTVDLEQRCNELKAAMVRLGKATRATPPDVDLVEACMLDADAAFASVVEADPDVLVRNDDRSRNFRRVYVAVRLEAARIKPALAVAHIA